VLFISSADVMNQLGLHEMFRKTTCLVPICTVGHHRVYPKRAISILKRAEHHGQYRSTGSREDGEVPGSIMASLQNSKHQEGVMHTLTGVQTVSKVH